MAEESTGTNVVYTDDDYMLVVYGSQSYKLHYYDGTLDVYRVEQQDDNEVLVKIMVQPYRCNPDGTNQAFTSAADAYAWFDDFKTNMM